MPQKVKPGQLGMATPFGEILGSSTEEMNAEFKDYKALGADWIRMDFHWDLVQPRAGVWNWSLIDKVVNAANAHGIKVVAVLEGVPGWLDQGLGTKASQAALGTFAGEAAKRYGDRVDHWEILNEPNKDHINAQNYTAGLKAAYTAIKAVDADDTVITGGTAPVPNTGNGMVGAVDYLEQMYDAGAKNYFDAVGYHPYTYPQMPSSSSSWNGWQMMEDGIRGEMLANGDGGKQIWMTEFGAPTAGSNTALTQAQQAQVIREAVDIAQDYDWAGPIMWYSYKDRGGSTNSAENWFGLVGPNGEKKAAYNTFKDLGNKDGGTVTAPIKEPAVTPQPAPTPVDQDDAAGDIIKVGTLTKWQKIAFDDGDTIDLSAIDASSTARGNQAFRFIGSNWLDDPRDLGVYHNSGQNRTYVQGDVDGDGAYDLNLVIDGIHKLTADDFIL